MQNKGQNLVLAAQDIMLVAMVFTHVGSKRKEAFVARALSQIVAFACLLTPAMDDRLLACFACATASY